MIEFSLSPEIVTLRKRVQDFVVAEVVPLEDDPRCGQYSVEESLRDELVAKGRAAGLLSPHAPREYGGMGLNHRDCAVIFEAASWSTLGALALNIQAPDEGNVNLAHKVGTAEQKAQWLPAIASGAVRTVFSMTETNTDGAGADASQLKTEAREVDGGYRINGRKYMISGLIGARLNIVMARTFDRSGNDLGATMFLIDIDEPGFRIDRMLETIDANTPGGHGEVSFDDVFVPHEQILGEVGRGFRNAQVRLGPARLTHCMRWLGLARRAHAIAADHAGYGAMRSASRSASIRGSASCSPTTRSTCTTRVLRSGTPPGCSTREISRATRPACARFSAPKPSGASSIGQCRYWDRSALRATPWSNVSIATSVPSASTTARRRSTGTSWPSRVVKSGPLPAP